MGLFNFIKSAGEKLFGMHKDASEESAELDESKKEQIEAENIKAAHKLEQKIHDNNLEIKDLKVEIEKDMASVSGLAKSQSTREKIILVVGNVEGIAQVEDNMEVENKEPEAIFHTVEQGDTLSKIAAEHYGNANKYQVIFEANKPMLKDPDKIYPGQVLRIPSEDIK